MMRNSAGFAISFCACDPERTYFPPRKPPTPEEAQMAALSRRWTWAMG